MHLNLFNGLVLLCFDEACMKHLCLIQSLFIIVLGFYIYHTGYEMKQLGRRDRYVKEYLIECLGAFWNWAMAGG